MKKQPKKTIKEVTEELQNKIIDGVSAMLDSQKYKDYLDFCSKMPIRSLNNQILIYLQKPEAHLVLGYRQWPKRFERHVKEGAKSIKIFAPYMSTIRTIEQFNKMMQNSFYQNRFSETEIESIINILNNNEQITICTGFKPVSVFDVSDTEGKALPEIEICKLLEGDVENYNKIYNSLVRIANISVNFKNKNEDSTLKSGARGYYSPLNDSITLKSGMSQIQTISTLVHEIAHSIMHSKEMKDAGINDSNALKEIKELQAESVSYMVCQRLGIKTDDKTFGYIASWIGNEDKDKTINTMKEHLNIITQCSNYIITELEKDLLPEKTIQIDKETIEESAEEERE